MYSNKYLGEKPSNNMVKDKKTKKRKMIKFLRINAGEASVLAEDNNEIYTPAYNQYEEYFIFREEYDPIDEPNTTELTTTEADGLTPVNPSKPIFKR